MNRLFHCPFCPSVLTDVRASSLRKHIAHKDHSADMTDWQCMLCTLEFRNTPISECLNHLINRHYQLYKRKPHLAALEANDNFDAGEFYEGNDEYDDIYIDVGYDEGIDYDNENPTEDIFGAYENDNNNENDNNDESDNNNDSDNNDESDENNDSDQNNESDEDNEIDENVDNNDEMDNNGIGGDDVGDGAGEVDNQVDAELLKKAELMKFLLHCGCSEENYRDHFVGSHMDNGSYPAAMKTLFQQVMKSARNILSISRGLKITGFETIDVVQPLDVVKFWMASDEIRCSLLSASSRYTAPFIVNIGESVAQRREQVCDPDYVFRGLESGTAWLEVLKNSEHIWCPRLLNNPELNVFIHFMVFQDGFCTSRVRRNKGHEAIYLSAGEFTFQERWKSAVYPVIVPLVILNKKTKYHLEDYSVTSLFTASFLALQKGVDIGRHRVFAYTTCILGDLPGRCEFVGAKVATFAKKCCYLCEMTNDELPSSFLINESYIEHELRNPILTNQRARSLGKSAKQQSKLQVEQGTEWGLSFHSEVLEWAPIFLSECVASDLMHTGIQGEDQKHLILFTRCFKEIDPEVWAKLSYLTNEVLIANKLKKIRTFSSEASYYKLTAHDKDTVFRSNGACFRRIGIPFALKNKFILLRGNSEYSSLLMSPEITGMELLAVENAMYHVKRAGCFHYNQPFYGRKKPESHSKEWITINSHFMMHTTLTTRRFGAPKATMVFAFESELGVLKRFLDRHKNGISEGSSMLRYFWNVAVSTLLLGKIKKSLPFDYYKFLFAGCVVALSNSDFAQVIYFDRDLQSARMQFLAIEMDEYGMLFYNPNLIDNDNSFEVQFSNIQSYFQTSTQSTDVVLLFNRRNLHQT